MTKSTKILLLTAGILIGIGMIIGGISMAIIKVRGAVLGSYDTGSSTSRESMVIDESFDSISVTEPSSCVTISPSNGSDAYVEYLSGDNFEHRIEVVNGTLKIEFKDARKWYDNWGINIPGINGLSVYDPGDVYIYLPAADYDKVSVTTASGDISFEELVCKEITASSASGEISVKSCVSSNRIELSSLSGNVKTDNLSGGTTEISTTSGDITLENGSFTDTDISSTSGEVELNSFKAVSTDIETTSGNIELDGYESEKSEISSLSGEVSGTLTGDYNIKYESLSGDIDIESNVPDGYPMSVETTSGDIELKSR